MPTRGLPEGARDDRTQARRIPHILAAATDMTAQVKAARAAGAEVLLVHAQGAAAVARSLEKIGWKHLRPDGRSSPS